MVSQYSGLLRPWLIFTCHFFLSLRTFFCHTHHIEQMQVYLFCGVVATLEYCLKFLIARIGQVYTYFCGILSLTTMYTAMSLFSFAVAVKFSFLLSLLFQGRLHCTTFLSSSTFPPFTLNLTMYHYKKQFFLNSVNLSFTWALSIQFSYYFLIRNVMLFDLVLNFETQTMSQILELI